MVLAMQLLQHGWHRQEEEAGRTKGRWSITGESVRRCGDAQHPVTNSECGLGWGIEGSMESIRVWLGMVFRPDCFKCRLEFNRYSTCAKGFRGVLDIFKINYQMLQKSLCFHSGLLS